MRAVLFGTGWRVRFFMRIAGLLPDILSISSVYTHSEERAAGLRKEGYAAFTDPDEALDIPHDAVIAASGKNGFFETLSFLHGRNERIISETTFLSLSDDELDEVSGYGGLVMEQYPYTPLFASVLNALPYLGEHCDQLYLSGLHNHHSAAIARRILGLGCQLPDECQAVDFPSRMVRTGSRKGMERAGEIEGYDRKVRLLRFSSSLFIHDFSSNQYHSYLYGKKLEARGERGIMMEDGINGIDSAGYPFFLPFVFHRDSSTGNGSLTLSHVTLGERTLFVNPYYPLDMNDDEIAMARMLELYGKGEDIYPFSEGVADARLGRLL